MTPSDIAKLRGAALIEIDEVALRAATQIDDRDRANGRKLKAWCGELPLPYEPQFSALALRLGDAVDQPEDGAGQALVTCNGSVRRQPLGFWGALLRGEKCPLDPVENVGSQRYGLVELNHQVRQHVRDQRLLHGEAAPQVGKLLFGRQGILHRLKAWMKAPFRRRAQ